MTKSSRVHFNKELANLLPQTCQRDVTILFCVLCSVYGCMYLIQENRTRRRKGAGPMIKLYHNNQWHFLDDTPEALHAFIEEHMGRDTVAAVQALIENNACSGECDETYKISDHYRRVIQSVLDELSGIIVRKGHEARFARAQRMLEAEL